MKRLFFILILASGLMAQSPQDSSYTKVKLEDFSRMTASDSPSRGIDMQYKRFALAQPNDKWFSSDKWSHLTTSYFAVIQSAYTFEHFFLSDHKTAGHIGIGVGISLSLGKEMYDAFYKKTYFSWKDLTYDIMGTSLAYFSLNYLK